MYKVYKRRFYMLLIYCASTCFNALAWISIAPISTTVQEVYGVSDFEVNLVSLIFLILFLPGMLSSTFIFDRWGLRNGLIIGSILQAVGASLKYFINQGFWIVLLGQGFIGLAQPYFLDSPSMVATFWFEDKLREIAITCGTNFNTIGIAFGFILPTFFVDTEASTETLKSQISMSLLVQGAIAVFL